MEHTPQPTASKPRLDSIDFLRGLVMVVMALDHVRDFFGNVNLDPTNLNQTFPGLFFTRWITHFCAPVFVFLAGTSIFLGQSRGKSKAEASAFLLTRGLWLVLLELTVVRFGWLFNVNYQYSFAQVIWAIGWSMVVMALLVRLPLRVVAALGIVMVAAHNLLDGKVLFERLPWIWKVFHTGGEIAVGPDITLMIVYPLIPWIGVMAAGYGFGALFSMESEKRKVLLVKTGLGLATAFFVLRAVNLYGNPTAWTVQPETAKTVMSFLNCEKYPPSLLFLLMTLGPAVLFLGLIEGKLPKWSAPFVTFGRVPLFYYVLHLPLIHVLAGFAHYLRYGPEVFRFNPFTLPPDFGYSLPVVYAAWVAVVALLYPPCAWFAGVKRRRKDAWLSYL